jgi:tripartite-type tricarboxylate transporter receptor subunit TctC
MRILFLFLGLLLQATAASGQEWPAKAVRMIVPFPAGGSADLLPRILGEKLAQQWGQPVIVENRPGAAGNIGAAAVFQAEPDGYTLLASPPSPLVINRHLYPALAFDPTQFVPMAVIAAIPNVLLVHPKLAVNSLAELIAYAKEHPGKLNYASQGNGTTSHLTTELLITMVGGLRMTHVPYKGSAPALADLLAGQADLMFDNLGVSLPHVKSGKLKALAVASPRRFRGLPDDSRARRDAARLRIGRVVRDRRAAENAGRGRGEGRRRRHRVAAQSRRAAAPRRPVGGSARTGSRRKRGVHEARERALERGDPRRRRQARVS